MKGPVWWRVAAWLDWMTWVVTPRTPAPRISARAVSFADREDGRLCTAQSTAAENICVTSGPSHSLPAEDPARVRRVAHFPDGARPRRPLGGRGRIAQGQLYRRGWVAGEPLGTYWSWLSYRRDVR